MEKYSVLMSLFIKEKPEFFRMSLESMINQSVRPDEIVLVEDGPLTDELYTVIDDYKDYLKIVRNEKNLGLGLALNKGLIVCRNELVARMDTDDISFPDRCEKQLLFFEKNPETTILGGQIEEFVDSTDNVVGRRILPETDSELKEFMKKRCPFNHMTVMFRKKDVIKAGSYQDWFWNEDYFLWIRLALEGFCFANLPTPLVHVRVGTDMYKRRGGSKYFKSEIGIQKYMLEKKMIGLGTYINNCTKRLIVERLLSNKLRSWAYKHFARN